MSRCYQTVAAINTAWIFFLYLLSWSQWEPFLHCHLCNLTIKVISYHDNNNVWPLPSARCIQIKRFVTVKFMLSNSFCHLSITFWQGVICFMRDRKPLKAEQDYFRVVPAKIKVMLDRQWQTYLIFDDISSSEYHLFHVDQKWHIQTNL